MGILKNFVAVAGAAAGLSLFAVSGAIAAPNPNFHIYIAYGQSNMAGNGDIVPAEDQAEAPKNFIMLASWLKKAGMFFLWNLGRFQPHPINLSSFA